MNKFIYYIILISCLLYVVSSTLEVVHLIFRHGARCPDKKYMYPDDPYINKTFAPLGFGQLTNLGKKQCYEFGLQIRKRYESLIGRGYNHKLVDPWSSASPRAQLSLLVTLAGLYKPISDEIWNNDLLWQPVQYKALSHHRDDLFLPVLNSKEYLIEYHRSFNGKGGQNIMQKYRHVIAFIKNHTGVDLPNTRNATGLYVTTEAEDCVGYALPEWFTTISDDLSQFAAEDYKMQISNRQLKRLAVGKLLRKIVDDTKGKIMNATHYKLHLYSGHDFNVAHMLLILGVTNITRVIPYISCVALEIRKDNKDMYNVHVIYNDNRNSNWTTKTVVPFYLLEQELMDIYGIQVLSNGYKYSPYYYLLSSSILCWMLYKYL